MNIYHEINYRKIVQKLVEERKQFDPNFNYQYLATQIRMQKSYLSKVLNGAADFNSDQLYLVCQQFELDSKQYQFMELLLEFERTTINERKRELEREITEIQQKHLETNQHIKAQEVPFNVSKMSEYYLDPMHQIVHICLSITRFRKNPLELAEALNIELSYLQMILERLEKMSVIERTSDGVKILLRNIHLPEKAAVYLPWRNQTKLLGMQALQAQKDDRAYSFAVTFSADEKTRNEIRIDFLEFLKRTKTKVEAVKNPKESFHMSFDLFRWT